MVSRKSILRQGIDPDIEESVRSAIEVLQENGAIIEEVSLPHTDYAMATYYIIAPGGGEREPSAVRWCPIRFPRNEDADELGDMYRKTRSEGFGEEVKRRIMLGTYALSSGYYDAYYLKAQQVRTLIKSDFDNAFEQVDVVVTPTSPTAAFKIGERMADPLQMYLSDVLTTPASLAGLPGISIPCGLTQDDLPIGLQILAAPFEEEKILRVAYTFEQNTDHHRKQPNLSLT